MTTQIKTINDITATKKGLEALTFRDDAILKDTIVIGKDTIKYLIYDTCPQDPRDPEFCDGGADQKTIDAYLEGDVYCIVTEQLNDKGMIIDYDLVGGYYGFDNAMSELKAA